MVSPQPLRTGKTSAPGHLGREESELFGLVVRNYDLRDEISLRILEEGCASLQRARLAREGIAKSGMTYIDGKGQPKPNPLCAVERDSRAAGLAAFRQLNLEMPRLPGKKAWT